VKKKAVITGKHGKEKDKADDKTVMGTGRREPPQL